jgi:GT2 family glycosyltransferase
MPSNLTIKSSYGDKISSFKFSDVDIIIPFHAQYTKLRKLVESILLYTTSNKYLITVVDDGSPNQQFLDSFCKTFPVHGVRMNTQRGFAAAINYGYEKTVNDWVCVLHSDCEIRQKNWLQFLGESMLALKKNNVKLVHSRTNNPMMDNPYLTKSSMEEKIKDVVVEKDEPLPLISALMHRGLFQKIGGLKPYPIAGYEDVELFYRMKKYGYKQAVCGKSWVHHWGGTTINALSEELRTVMDDNYKSCVKDIQLLN